MVRYSEAGPVGVQTIDRTAAKTAAEVGGAVETAVICDRESRVGLSPIRGATEAVKYGEVGAVGIHPKDRALPASGASGPSRAVEATVETKDRLTVWARAIGVSNRWTEAVKAREVRAVKIESEERAPVGAAKAGRSIEPTVGTLGETRDGIDPLGGICGERVQYSEASSVGIDAKDCAAVIKAAPSCGTVEPAVRRDQEAAGRIVALNGGKVVEHREAGAIGRKAKDCAQAIRASAGRGTKYHTVASDC